MIKFYNQVPTVYSKTSRDFQYLSWLINIVLNSVKHNVDDMYLLPSAKVSIATTELLAMTLGFKVRRQYNQQQLIGLIGVLPAVLKKKGSVEALNLVAMALSKAIGTDIIAECKVEDNKIKIFLPRAFKDITLLLDIFPYIAPAGLTCEISRDKVIRYPIPDAKYETKNILRGRYVSNKDLAQFYSVDADDPSEAGFNLHGFTNLTDDQKINSGLISNAMIFSANPENTDELASENRENLESDENNL